MQNNPIDVVTEDIARQGWSIQTNFFDKSLTDDLYAECLESYSNGSFAAAGVGRRQELRVNQDIRNDKIRWLENQTNAQSMFLAQMEQLRLQLNRSLFLGLFDYEAHFAVYPAGGFYKKHVDQFTGKRARVVTTVTYLNPEWATDNGGQLVIYDPKKQNDIIATTEPKAGTFVCFLSENFPHEVQPASKQRASIAGWFRLRD